MRTAIAILTALTLALTATPSLAADPPRSPFTDVAAHPFLADIVWLADSGITTGFPDGTFRPGEPISREAFAAFLYRYAHPGTPAPACTGQAFDDVPVSHPFCGHITWLADTGITTGYPDGGFHPGSKVSREAVAAMLQRYRALAVDTDTACDPTRFRDLAGSTFCREITWLAGTGITTGYPDGTFRPSAQVTREAVAAYLHRYEQAFGPLELPPVRCGQTVTEDVTLVEDLQCEGTGLVLTSGVTLDLGGHTVRYVGPVDPAPGTAGVSGWGADGAEPITDVVVRNGTIAGYAVAVELGVPDGLLLEDLDVDGRVDVLFGKDITVRTSRIRGDVSAALSWAVTLQDNTIEGSVWLQAGESSVIGNHIDAGGDVGISLFEASSPAGAVIADNTIRSASAGIELAWYTSNTEVRDNEIADSQVGIELDGYLLEGNVLRGNVITDVAGHGILGAEFGVEEPLTVEENVIRNAGGDGIRFVADDSGFPLVGLVISRNRVTDVLGHAVYAPAATGEGNVTANIGAEPRCVGPRCV